MRAIMIGGLLFVAGVGAAAAQQNRPIPAHAAQQLRAFGAVRVIARVNLPAPIPGLAAPAAATVLAEAISQPNLIEARPIGQQLVRAVVREQGLTEMLQNSSVAEVFVDTLSEPYLQESAPLINAPKVWVQQNTGTGFAVAVLDSGVDRTHPALAEKVVHEACFSSTDAAFGSETVCPSGREEEIGAGAAAPCPLQIRGCDHGTHVAGIAAGAAAVHNNKPISGIAPGAPIIAIQVFSRFRNPQICGSPSPCVLSWTSDQVLALQHVRSLAAQIPIAAANMSLGSGRATQPCDANALKADIDQLRTMRIATIIAAGNDAFPDAVGEPACISSAISVGASNDSDQIATSFSNRAPFMSLLAPGDAIIATIPGGFGRKDGTSMATPHVAGVWALLRSAQPQATVDQILTALRASGKAISDPSVPQRRYQRINAEGALAALRQALVGGPVALTGATGQSPATSAPAGAAALAMPAANTGNMPTRVIIPTPLGTKPGDLLNTIDPSKIGNTPLTIRQLPGPGNRFSITATPEIVEDLRLRGFSPQMESLSAPQ